MLFSGDGYIRNTNNMFTVGQTLPAVFGAAVPNGNYANMKTVGWEVSLAWHDQFSVARKPFHYNIAFWMSDYSSTITKYNNTNENLANTYYTGMKVGEIWGYVNDGYWTDANVNDPKTGGKATQAFIKASNSGQFLPGDIKFKDLNGDGVINNGNNTVTNSGDTKVIGNTTPRYAFGANLGADWHNFFISSFFQGIGEEKWYPGAEADVFWGQYNRPYNQVLQSQVGHIWSESNPNAYWPRYRGYEAGSGELGVSQTKYLQNVAYIRLKNIQIGYNLPAGVVKRARITAARFYISGENLWSWSPMYRITRNIDPESIRQSDVILTGTSNNGNGNNYPILKSVTIGLSATL
jgi:hypothetical protein